ncbi:sigma-70 family RNA polymerase sigma factor, partial [Streptococcus sp. 27098_8_69]
MLEKYYAKVKGIVHKCRKDYYLHLWEKEDWDQE